MAIETNINTILDSGNAVVRGLGMHIASGDPQVTSDRLRRVDDICWAATCVVNPAANRIEFQAVARGTVGANAVIVGNASSWAATGLLTPPGFVYSDSFSGCNFFLFRTPTNGIYAVHSYRENGQYADPMEYMTQRNAKLLYYFQTAGQMSRYGANVFGAVICYVSLNKISINFFAYNTQTSKVVAVVDRQRIDNWTGYEIGDPHLPGQLGPNLPPLPAVPQPPAAVGLKKRVENFFLSFIR